MPYEAWPESNVSAAVRSRPMNDGVRTDDLPPEQGYMELFLFGRTNETPFELELKDIARLICPDACQST